MGADEAQKQRKGTKRKIAKIQWPERYREIVAMVRRCLPDESITTMVSHRYQISKRHAREYLAKTYRQLEDEYREAPIDAVLKRIVQFEGVMVMALNRDPPDFKAALIALDRLCRIQGAYQPERLQIDQRQEVVHRVAGLSPEEREKRIEQLLEMRAEWIKSKKKAGELPPVTNGRGQVISIPGGDDE